MSSLHHLHDKHLLPEFYKNMNTSSSGVLDFVNEHTSSFLEVKEGEVNVESDIFFDVDILQFIKGE